jgi:hypothetical protein
MGYAAGEQPHLGVSALLAGVLAESIWQGDYLLECF